MISRAQISQILKIYRAENVKKSSFKGIDLTGAVDKVDDIKLSATQDDLAKIRDIVKAMPDIREDRVRDLKQQVQAGTYEVGADEVADKMMGRLLTDRVK